MILKSLQFVREDFYDLQNKWRNKRNGSFADFNGAVIYGIRFRHEFASPSRGDGFPIDDLFRRIDEEIDNGRFVCVSLEESYRKWHMYVIHVKNNDEYSAFSKNGERTIEISQVKNLIRRMQGTDILSYQYAREG
jgi:hypothetical protein